VPIGWAGASRPFSSAAASGDTGPMTTLRDPRPGVTGALFDTAERWTYLGIGLASFVSKFSDQTYDSVATGRAKKSRHGVPAGELQGTIALLPGAAMGLVLHLQRRGFDNVAEVEGQLGRRLGSVCDVAPVAPALLALNQVLGHWDEQFRVHQDAQQVLATDFLARYGPATLDALLARVDMQSIIDRVDVDDVIDKVDINALVDRVPVDRVLDRVDLRSVVLDTVSQVQVTDILREGTGAMRTSTAEAIRGQVNSATKIAGRFRREAMAANTPSEPSLQAQPTTVRARKAKDSGKSPTQ